MGQILVEGSIGVGKSLFLNEAMKYFAERPHNPRIVEEPIEIWTDYCGVNLLEEFNRDPMNNCFKFELMVMKTMLDKHGFIGPKDTNPIILERSLYSAFEVFVESQRNMGYLDDVEFSLLFDYYALFVKKFSRREVDLLIYLEANPSTLMRRVEMRGRPEEKSIVTLEYLQELNDQYDLYIENWEEINVPVIRIDTDVENSVVLERYRECFQKIETSISEMQSKKRKSSKTK